MNMVHFSLISIGTGILGGLVDMFTLTPVLEELLGEV